MTSEAKLAANRRNALRSTGPRTARGKALASQNALQHGLLSWLPVLPSLEVQEDWDAHMSRVFESLAPAGYMEKLLAERIACLLWRLARAVRYEREISAIGIEDELPSEDDGLSEDTPEGLRQSVQEAQDCLALAKGIANLKDKTSVDDGPAATLLKQAETVSEVTLEDDDWNSEGEKWTAGELRALLDKLVAAGKTTLEAMMEGVTEGIDAELSEKQRELAKAEAKISRGVRRNLLPTADETAMLCRYEGHLERCFYKALHELQRLQAARSGVPVPPPAALDVTLDGGFVPQNDAKGSG